MRAFYLLEHKPRSKKGNTLHTHIINYYRVQNHTSGSSPTQRGLSFAVARVAGAVVAALAVTSTILRSGHRRLKATLSMRSNSKDLCLAGAAGEGLLTQVRVHIASRASGSALAVGSAPAVPSTARHFLLNLSTETRHRRSNQQKVQTELGVADPPLNYCPSAPFPKPSRCPENNPISLSSSLFTGKAEMIRWSDFYHVMTAMVPLYVAMILAYGSVKWWSIFTPEQCSGINRFVALFAVPLLSFHFISTNNPYAMNLRFIAADTLQKLIVLAVLTAWASLSSRGSLDWTITFFSLSTLPNTLVMGIPLLKGMYGDFSGSLMVQIVVLQCIIWYTLMLFMFEYRGARLLIAEQFPDTAASIVSIAVDSDVLSLDARRDPLETEAELKEDGRLHVTVRRSSASRSGIGATPRPSNLTNAEIYSLQSSRNPTPRGSSFNHTDFYSMVGGRSSNFASSDAYGLMGPPRHSNFDEENSVLGSKSRFYPAPNPSVFVAAAGGKKAVNGQAPEAGTGRDLHMFVWSSTASPVSDVFGNNHEFSLPAASDIPNAAKGDAPPNEEFRLGNRGVTAADNDDAVAQKVGISSGGMPPTSVMTRLILIMVWRKLIRNPNTYSSLIGIIWALVSYRWNIAMPAIVSKSISILSDAGLGMAMFSLGLFMALQPRIIACGNKVAGLAMGVRFLAGPAVMAASSIAVGLHGSLLHVAIVQAALPQGIVPFVFAKEYSVHPDILSTAVIFGMLIALPITLVYYILMGL